jgi:hypothetical protein
LSPEETGFVDWLLLSSKTKMELFCIRPFWNLNVNRHIATMHATDLMPNGVRRTLRPPMCSAWFSALDGAGIEVVMAAVVKE